MKYDELRVEIDGSESEELYQGLVSLEVELDEELAGMFRITLALMLRPDGSWTYLDDDRFTLWRRVVVTAGVEDDARQLITGYITQLCPAFGPGLDQCRLEVWGMDASVLMDRVKQLRDWPNKKDSDIATETFQAYGLTPKVTDTEVVHEEEVSTVVQRETDIQLLRRLAQRNGYECFVDGGAGYFRPPAVSDTPQPVLAVHFGDETNVDRFRLEADALAPADVVMYKVDHLSGELLEAAAAPGHRPALGATPATGITGPDGQRALVTLDQSAAAGVPEMTALCQSAYDEGEWFVTGEGEVAANQYGGVLKPRSTVTVKGIGETHSGVYYVSHVTHRFTADGYTQGFRVKRNALLPAGDEDFAAGAVEFAATVTVGAALGEDT